MGLRVLVIDAFLASKDGRHRLKDFLRAVSWAIKQNNHLTGFHILVRSLTQLQEFVFDPDADESGRKQALRNFSSVDMTFIGGEATLLPWQPETARLVAFINQSVIAGSRVCGSVVAARALWHLACTCGRQLHVVDVLQNPDLPAAIPTQYLPKAFSGRNTVMLQEISGEAFQFSNKEPEDNKRAPRATQHESSHDESPAKRRAVAERCLNVGMRKRAPGQSTDANLSLTQCRGLEFHWLMKDLLKSVAPKPTKHKPSSRETQGKGAGEKGGGESGGGRVVKATADANGMQPVLLKCERAWDLNAAQGVLQNPLIDPVGPLRGQAPLNFTARIGEATYRGQSAKCRQPDRPPNMLICKRDLRVYKIALLIC